MPPPQFCPLCAKKGKKTKILPLSINLSVGVNMCISVKCTYPFGEYVITELPSPSGQELSKIIQEVAEENKEITDEDIISSVENRQIPKMDENIYYPDIDDSFILQQLNQHLDTGISEYPSTNHLVDNETLADDSTHILTDAKEEISISPKIDQLAQKPFNQKNTVAMNIEISDFPNTNNLVDSDTSGCNVNNLLTDTVEEISISTEFDQQTQKPLSKKNMVAVNKPKKTKTVQDMNIDVSEFPNTVSLDDNDTLVCDLKHVLPNTVEKSGISTELNQPTQRTFKRNTAFAVHTRNNRKAAVLTSPNNTFQGKGEPDFLNKITEQYMGDVSNFVDFIKSSFRGTPSESGNGQLSEGGNTDQNKPEDITEDDAPNNHKPSEPTKEAVKLPEKVVKSTVKDVQSIKEIFQPIKKVIQLTPEIVQPIEKVLHSITEIAQPIEKAFSIVVLKDEMVTPPFSIVVQKDEKVTQPFSIALQNAEKVVEPITEKVVQSLERVVLTKAKAAQLQGKVNILKKKKKSNLDTFVEDSDSDLEIVELPKVPNKNKKCESNLKLLSLSRRHTVLKRSSPRVSSGPTRFL